MKDLHLPVFSNTCGKLYNDYIVLASSNNERTLPLTSVKKIKFRQSIGLSSFAFMLLPFALLFVPNFINDADDIFLKVILYGLGILSLVAGILMAERVYTVKIYTVNNAVLKIKLIEENKRDAKKFVAETRKLLAISKAIVKAERTEQRTAENIYTTANVVKA